MAVFKLNTTEGGQFNFSLKNDADKTLVKSEQYNTKAAAENGIESVKNNADNAARYDAKASDSGKFYFNLKAGNGQIILTSELYKTKVAAENGIESVRKNAPDDGRYERTENKNGEPYFKLKAANGQEIGRSEYYSSKAAMENGIESVKKNAPDAEVVEKQA